MLKLFRKKRISALLIIILLTQIIVPSGNSAACEPDITVDPLSIDYGFVQVGSSSSENITITNNGDGNLTIGNIFITGTHAGEFDISFDNASNQTLVPGATVYLTVTFSPTSNDVKWAIVVIQSNDDDENPVCVSLSGNDVATQANLSITKTDSPDPVAAGNNLTYNITITNHGPYNATEVFVFDMFPTDSLAIQSTTPSTGIVSQSLPAWVINYVQQQHGITLPIPGFSFLSYTDIYIYRPKGTGANMYALKILSSYYISTLKSAVFTTNAGIGMCVSIPKPSLELQL